MESHGVFAEAPATPDPIIAQVSRQLVAEYGHAPHPTSVELDQVARAAVLDLWSARVKTFLPVLALRDARETLGDAFATASAPAATPGVSARTARRSSDVLRVNDDVVLLDPADRLSLDD